MTKEALEKEIRKYLKETFHHEYYDDVVMIMGFAEPREKRIAELEAQIEKMKCCGNCRLSESDRLNGTFCHKEGCHVLASAKCKLWER